MIKIPARHPFNPTRIPFFYGWIILFAGIIGIIMSIPGQTMGVSVFTNDLIKDLGIERVDLSKAYMFGTILSGLIITYAGILYDRAGARIIAMGAGILLGLVLVYLSRIEALIAFFERIAGNTRKDGIVFFLVFFGFFGIRFFGQGVLTMTSRNMVMKWFDKKRGFANGILGVFTAIAFSLSPQVLNSINLANGWRTTYLILAVVLGLFVVFAFIFFRDNPGDAGMIPDGRVIKERLKGVKSTADRDSDLKEVVRSFSFWIFNLNISLIALYYTAMTFHIESIFDHAGLDSRTAYSIFFPASIIAAIIHITGSWLSDYIRLKYILSASYAAALLSLTGLLFLKNYGSLPLIIGNGIIIGTYNILIAVTWPRFYGLKHLGKISGFVMSCGVFGSALGPYLFSLAERQSGSYSSAIIFTGILSFILLILSFMANNTNDERVSVSKKKDINYRKGSK